MQQTNTEKLVRADVCKQSLAAENLRDISQ